jgi:tripartite ATP-independent transporter DctM subunit
MSIPLLIFLIFFVLMFIIRIPIPFGFIVAAFFYMLAKDLPLSLVASNLVDNLWSKYVLMAVPLFIFTAKIMNTGKVTDKLFNFANALVGNRPGGLGHVNVLASLIFSGMTGSAIADASGLGTMEIEQMRKHKYGGGFSCAITSASATIGPVFPPSIPMILYSMLSGASVGALFLGGMVPGVMLAVALMFYINLIAKRRNFPQGEKYTFGELVKSTLDALPALLTPIILLGGIYTGVMTPTEAGAVAAFYAILISLFWYRSLTFKGLLDVIVDTVKTTGGISLIAAGAFNIVYIVSREQIPQMVTEVILGFTSSPIILLLMVNIIFLILGMVVPVLPLILVFIPIVLPIVTELGINLTHFGVVIVLNIMIALSTPPYGMLIFITSGISGVPIAKIIREIFPMILVSIFVLALITYIPDLVMFLPRLLGQ